MISFRGAPFPADVIPFAVFFSVRYTVSCRDPEEGLTERGVQADHATLNRSWRMDETDIRVQGEWVYRYRAVDKFGKALEFARRRGSSP